MQEHQEEGHLGIGQYPGITKFQSEVVSAFKQVVEMKINSVKVARLACKPIRLCRSVHGCCVCGKDVVFGEQYYDGGYDKRAHKNCIDDHCARIDGKK